MTADESVSQGGSINVHPLNTSVGCDAQRKSVLGAGDRTWWTRRLWHTDAKCNASQFSVPPPQKLEPPPRFRARLRSHLRVAAGAKIIARLGSLSTLERLLWRDVQYTLPAHSA